LERGLCRAPFFCIKTEKTLFSDEITLAFCLDPPYNSYDKERSVDPMTDFSKLSGVCASIFMPEKRTGVSAILPRKI